MSEPKYGLLSGDALQLIADRAVDSFEVEAQAFLSSRDKPSIRSGSLVNKLQKFFKDDDLAKALASQLVALAVMSRIERRSVEVVCADIISSLKYNSVDEKAQAWFEQKASVFTSLTSSDDVKLVAKTLHLGTDFPKLFTNAFILTDIRPIFDKTREAIAGGIVTQSIKIHYLSSEEGSDSHEITLSLDDDDIEKLLKELQKAKKKSKVAAKFVKSSLGENGFVLGEDSYGFS
ncbi:hypothetical protein [Pacificibacter marinus]|uniref:hypothetical protein n=1 Tax=Pacificibacter marinus TaxID=658057 RepID=UPI001C0720E6|nr:hypothetical protein [Pacificibacter marinus]MBU2866055.1 hypothetical protein [Pacificibacter marinus]